MPVRRNIVGDLVRRVVGIHVWNGLIGEPVTIPRKVWDRVEDAADQLYDEVVRRIDWKRIHIEASSRHLQLHPHRGEGPCGECIQQALLYREEGLGLSALHRWEELPTIPERTARPDWAMVFADAVQWRQPGDDALRAGVPAPESRPSCGFDDCDGDELPAVAVVPLTSTGMTTPYRWVMSCAVCLPVWQRANPDARPIALRPAPVETSIEWGVWWHGGRPDGIVLSENRLGSRQRAEERAKSRLGELGIHGYTLVHCEHERYADGSTCISDWTRVETVARGRPVPEGGWPPGGRVAEKWRICASCGDDIGSEEHVYPADTSGDTSETAGVACAICEVRTRAAESAGQRS